MTERETHHEDRYELDQSVAPITQAALGIGALSLITALLIGVFALEVPRRFYFAYLVSFSFVMTLSIGGLFFVLLQHLTRAGWSVNVRRIAEALAANMPVVAILALPLAASVILNNGQLYRWAQPLPADLAHHDGDHDTKAGHADDDAAHAGGADHGGSEGVEHLGAVPTPLAPEADVGFAAEPIDAEQPEPVRSEYVVPPIDHLTAGKLGWLNPWFFLGRLVIYFGFWSFVGTWFWRMSKRQDETGDPALTSKMQWWAPLATLGFAGTVTLGSFDIIMSIDPVFYSTIFGVYIFAGSVVASLSVIILILMLLQGFGFLTRAVTVEHYHDLGKLLFAFVFFWGYIAFSQYMLIWYANLPETTYWFDVRGATTASGEANAWSVVIVMLLFGHLLIPFAGLLSRHVKRNKPALAFWAVWLLVFHFIDLWWLIMPEIGPMKFPYMELLTLAGVGGIYVAGLGRTLAAARLLPARDPRLDESLAFENV